ncbi:branched-chain amino acid ABC transporter substrate-binding protein [Bradyrhizobium sp. KBS0727]|nr:branched-chain amino acid ABC transporter substrate-binding protein [Bradyrhizobium sp. KBS0725]QDW44194.1 branched-chain amino acid ABC transporter substrate-binding protein [Bradyrhizobium sp. KBS0727]
MLRVRGAQEGVAVAGQIVVAAGAVSMLRFRPSTATKTIKRATSGEKCTMLRGKWLAVFSGIVLAIANCGYASAQATIKVAYTDPLSGPFAQVGDANLKQMQYIIDYINSKGGALGKKFELVPFDNKSQPSDALIALKSATDQNMPFIMQCSGSNIAAALIDAVNKHNERNPDNRIIYLNCGAVATELTNEQCSFWHFRFDLHVGMKAEVMVRALPKTVTKVYLINQDYLFGQSVQREVKNYLAKLRPDVQVVGDELIPLGKIKDFSPYLTKIKASGAQALLTGNWGPDMNLLIKAGVDSGADLHYYTFYAHLAGGPTAIGAGGDNRVLAVMSFGENVAPAIGNKEAEAFAEGFREKHKFDFSAAGFRTIFEYLQAAVNKAGAVDATKIATAMEDLSLKDFLGFDTKMRKDDHQIITEYFVGTFKKGVKYDAEGTGLGWENTATILAKDVDQPNSCKMKRPSGA